MNVFEFLLVIVSIVLGLGITELLAGFVRILRGELVAGKLHALWMFVILQLQVQPAWGLWGLRSKADSTRISTFISSGAGGHCFCFSRATYSLPACSAGFSLTKI